MGSVEIGGDAPLPSVEQRDRWERAAQCVGAGACKALKCPNCQCVLKFVGGACKVSHQFGACCRVFPK